MRKSVNTLWGIFFVLMSYGCGMPTPDKTICNSTTDSHYLETYDGYAGGGQTVGQYFTESPRRVFAVSQPVTEDLIFLGVSDRIIATSECLSNHYAPYTEQMKLLKDKELSRYYPSKEAVLNLHPDIIISWGSLFGNEYLGSVKYWHQKGIKTYVMKNTVPTRMTGPRKVRYIVDDLINLSKIFQVEDLNRHKINLLEQQINKYEREAQEVKDNRPRVITVQKVYGNEYFGRSSTDMTSDIIRLAGGVSIDAGSKEYGKQSLERLVKLNPDVIMIVNMPGNKANEQIKKLRNNPVVQHVKAIEQNHFFIIDYSAFYCGSYRTILALNDLHSYLSTF